MNGFHVTAHSAFRRAACVVLMALSGIAGAALPPAIASAAEAADHDAYVLLTSARDDAVMSGTTDDLRRARALRTEGRALLYVRQGGHAYVVRDPALLAQAETFFEPQEAMGRRQAELGSRQSALGGRQSALGAQQARLGARQAGVSGRRADDLGRRQDVLGRQQDELGRQQDALGRQQDALGREQDRLAREADAKLHDLFDNALRRGVALRVD